MCDFGLLGCYAVDFDQNGWVVCKHILQKFFYCLMDCAGLFWSYCSLVVMLLRHLGCAEIIIGRYPLVGRVLIYFGGWIFGTYVECLSHSLA